MLSVILIIVLILVIFTLLVVAHEWGHFTVAKRNGVGVEEFGLGFPPRLVSRLWRGTLYTLNAIPLGGFVRLKGEDGVDLASDSFAQATISVKARVLLAGVGMNVVVGFLLLLVLCWTHLPGIGSFEPGFLPKHYAQTPRLLLVDVVPGSPAATAGLVDGNYLTAANGHALTADNQLLNFTQQHAGHTVELTTVVHGRSTNLSVKLRPPDTKSGYLGVETQAVYRLHYGWWQGVVAAAWITGKLFLLTIWAVILLIIHLPALVIGLFQSQIPTAAANAAGPVGIFFILKSITALGTDYVLLVVANISIALAAFNVLPIPALDGGRLALSLVQQVGRRRLRAQTEALVHAIGFFALLILVAIITVYDVRRQF